MTSIVTVKRTQERTSRTETTSVEDHTQISICNLCYSYEKNIDRHETVNSQAGYNYTVITAPWK